MTRIEKGVLAITVLFLISTFFFPYIFGRPAVKAKHVTAWSNGVKVGEWRAVSVERWSSTTWCVTLEDGTSVTLNNATVVVEEVKP